MSIVQRRVAIYYHTSFGRNDGPPLYYYFNLKKLPNWEVMHLVPQGDISRFGKFNYHFWVDYGEDGLPVDRTWQIPKDGGKTIYVASDAHLGSDYRFEKAKSFDYVFFNQKRAMEEYNRLLDTQNLPKNPVIAWLPHAAEPQAYHPFEILKRWDVCFIGHVQTEKNYNGFTRVEALDRLFKEFPDFYYGTRNPLEEGMNLFEDAAKKYCQSRIVLNVSIKDDLNMRVFEVLATKSFLLTNWIPTLDDLFEDGKHLVSYKTLPEMIQKARYYLSHKKEREKIAQAGYDEFIKKHTYAHRIQTVLQAIGGS